MKVKNIYLGTIKEGTTYYTGEKKHQGKTIVENAILIRVTKGAFVSIADYRNIFDKLRTRKYYFKNGFSLGGKSPLMTYYSYEPGSPFIDEDSLKHYPSNKKHISVKKLIKNAKKQ